MSNIDKQAVQAVADLKAGYTLGHADVAILSELARIALASLEAEAVGFIARHKETGKFGSYLHPKADWFKNDEYEVLNAYTAPPAPVSVPDEATPENIEILASTFAPRGVTYQWDRDECNAAADSWNACRAARLQGDDGNSPVIQDGWVMVPVDATRAMIDAARRVEEDGYDAMHKAMIAAAPQQEVK
ncbi:hypothetical protein ABKV81_03655 [Enterobacter hormaechei]|uniref:hypothetical protein n=1 Tax=Enterobacter hormaechei TaxID=158836 RepID=UPI0005EF5E32|nr:hypothetical protein [Enterobacter hormaechei]KJM74849.1 hypothetical protein SS28_07450 [Enterobacter hormaechei subsp. steigerwaltii]